MTDLSWHFAQPAEAHEAYLITELGNLFLVKDAQTANGGIFNFIFQQKAEQLAQHAGLQIGDASWFFLYGLDNPVAYSHPTQHLDFPDDTQHIGLIKLTSSYLAVSIAQFGHNYTYDPNTQTLINPVQHQSSADFLQSWRSLSGSHSVQTSFAGVAISGNGIAVAKLDSASLDGKVPGGSSVRFVTSPNNLMGSGVSHDGSKFVLYDKTLVSQPANRNSTYKYVYDHHFDLNHPDSPSWTAAQAAWDTPCYPLDATLTCQISFRTWLFNPARVNANFYVKHYSPDYHPINAYPNVYVKDDFNNAFTMTSSFLNRLTDRYGNSIDADFFNSNVDTYRSGAYLKINNIHQDGEWGAGWHHSSSTTQCWWYNPQEICSYNDVDIKISSHVTIRDTAPFNASPPYHADFFHTYNSGSNSYVLLYPNGNTITLSEMTTGTHPIISIDGLPADMYFKIDVPGEPLYYGKTSRAGTISLDTDDIAIDAPNHSATLTLYEGALTSMRVSPSNVDLGTVLFDAPNGEVLLIGTDSEAYAPFIHATIPTTDGLLVSNTYINGTKGQVHLPYLDGLYLGNEELWVPNVPGFDSVGTEFDGQPVTMLFSNLQFG